MLIPAGMPEPANDKTSKLVKSGLKNVSFSKSFDQGSFGIILSALSTRAPNARVRSRLTVAAKPTSVLVEVKKQDPIKIVQSRILEV